MPRGGRQIPLSESTKSELIRLYRETPELNVKGVAELVGCAISTAWTVLTANGIEIRGASQWQKEKNHKQRILRRWDAGQSIPTISRRFTLQREGVARVIAANRPYDDRLRKMLKGVFGQSAETRAFLNSISSPRNAGLCAICRSSEGTLVKNYCRQRQTLRAVLCSRCNQGLGCFTDDAAKVLRALAYLIKHQPAAWLT